MIEKEDPAYRDECYLLARSKTDRAVKFAHLILKRQPGRCAAQVCSNQLDIRWPQPASTDSVPAPVIANDRAVGSSHRKGSNPVDTAKVDHNRTDAG